MGRAVILLLATLVTAARRHCSSRTSERYHRSVAQGKPAFGVYAPNENPGPRGAREKPPRPAVYTREGGEKLAMNPLYDFVFLNLEGNYDAAAVKAIAEGWRSPKATGRKMLMVSIPSVAKDGAATARARVKEVLDAGADGVAVPHVRTSRKRGRPSVSSRMRKPTSGRRGILAARSWRC